MRTRMTIPILAAAACLPALAHADEEPSEAEKLFALKVRPLLKEKCFACHGENPKKVKGSLVLTSRERMLEGGETSGDVLVPGKADKSLLYIAAAWKDPDYEMPPKEADKMTEEQTWVIRDWINGGAPWPDEKRAATIVANYSEGVTHPTSGGLADDWTNRRYKKEDLWAYRPIARPDVPKNAPSAIDHFIGAELTKLGVAPAPAADRRTLIRRSTFDLLGLPPTPEEIDKFVNDPAPDDEAFARVIDRLLASPHYGEQWGRHWLDVVRYADSSGFANDFERPNSWRYRDYVIRAFNDDKPYDQFIREQVAGDEIDPMNPENLIATGFLRMGPWEHTAMSVAKITRQQFLDDVTDSVGQVFLAHALQCARCHDHKFDPVPTRDYYAMQAVFATTQFADRPAKWLPKENRNGMKEDERFHRMRTGHNKMGLGDLTARKKKGELKTPEEFGYERIRRKWSTRFKWELDRYQPIAFSVYSGKTKVPGAGKRVQMPKNPMASGRLEKTAILTGGDPFAPAQAVDPGVLSAEPTGLKTKLPKSPAGRRTALADWIASPDNALTARVMANRVWHYHFGRGLSGTPNNFGATGNKPTHPELLDWLASGFVAKGWSVKHLHRVIMQSATYRRACSHPDPKLLDEKDPTNTSYATFQPRRLSAEELRDAMLAVSGELNREIGGIPARPDMNLEAALQPRMIMGTFAPSYVPNATPDRRNRRSVYAHKTRGQRDPFMEVFNQPGPDKSCEMRDSSNVTPQVFTLFNSEESADRALAFAARVLKETKSDKEAIERAIRLAYGRAATSEDLALLLPHWKAMEKPHAAKEPVKRDWPTKVTREAIDENTGKPFTFEELLFVYKEYVPDLQPSDVDAHTRAFAEVCLVLLNSNEFVYVY